MSEDERDVPVNEPLPTPGQEPARPAGWIGSVGSRIKGVFGHVPGARPRPRFDVPPEALGPGAAPEPEVDEDTKLTDERLRFGGVQIGRAHV